MTRQFKVSSIACSGCVEAIAKAIQAVDAAAVVTGDASTKLLTVASSASDAQIHAAITAAGHEISA
jgi:copper chaperone